MEKRKQKQTQALLFEEDSLAGPVDPKALSDIEFRHTLDPSYRELIHTFHGGIPVQQYIKGKGRRYRLGRFLTILDRSSQLPGPFQPHFEQSKIDCRIVRSILFAIDGECATSRALFYGRRLLPFAAFYAGDGHPDEMCLDRAYVSFLCFDYGTGALRPPVVVWHAHDANDAYMEWDFDDCPFEESDPDAPLIDYNKFTERIADNFDEFVKLMQLEP